MSAWTRRIGVPLLAATAAACGGRTPTGPSVQAIAILGESAMAVGAIQTLTAQVTLSDGRAGQPVDVLWSSSDISIASVTPPPYYSGPTTSVGATTELRARAPGLVTVFADYGHRRAEARITVVPSYEGTWLGTYAVTACSGTGSAEDLACRQTFRTGAILPIVLTLTQQATSVSGSLALGPTTGSVSGSALVDGRLILSGGTEGSGMAIAITDWSTTRTFATRMQGGFSVTLTFASSPGVATLVNSLRDVSLTGRLP